MFGIKQTAYRLQWHDNFFFFFFARISATANAKMQTRKNMSMKKEGMDEELGMLSRERLRGYCPHAYLKKCILHLSYTRTTG